MHENIGKCDACGSSRVTAGRLDDSYGSGTQFAFSEYNGSYWFTWSNVPRAVTIRQDRVRLCLDCGNVTASLSVDVEEAKMVLDKWGTDALKSRLAIGPPAP
jgi:hypothetical protein